MQHPGPACLNAWRSEHEPGLLGESSQSSKQKVPAPTRRAALQGKHSANAFKSISGLSWHKELMGMEDWKGVCNYHHCAGGAGEPGLSVTPGIRFANVLLFFLDLFCSDAGWGGLVGAVSHHLGIFCLLVLPPCHSASSRLSLSLFPSLPPSSSVCVRC